MLFQVIFKEMLLTFLRNSDLDQSVSDCLCNEVPDVFCTQSSSQSRQVLTN